MGNVPYPVTWPNLRVGWGYGPRHRAHRRGRFPAEPRGLRDTQRTTDVIASR